MGDKVKTKVVGLDLCGGVAVCTMQKSKLAATSSIQQLAIGRSGWVSVSDPDPLDPGILLNPDPDPGCCWVVGGLQARTPEPNSKTKIGRKQGREQF